ncbi:MAG TPA: FtsX-like permease family protein [Candidatus Saccharimonadales bacterium]|nr:FtsX-like permease family protein [Candidatus Saccharimonadales bacterium]
MNIISRGIRNAFRNIVRSGSIIIILALSIGLVIAMLAARQAVQDKIASVKANTGNTITVSPAGVRGFDGGGNPLTSDQLAKVANISHVTKVVETLNDRLTSSGTSLKSGIDPGSLGRRNASNSGIGEGSAVFRVDDSNSDSNAVHTFSIPVTITGTNNESAIKTAGTTSLSWKSGKMFDTTKDANVAVIGAQIASKNNLSVSSTFTAYNTTFTVVGIYDAGNTFNNDGVYIPLPTLQKLSDQSGDITSATVTIDSSDNLASVTNTIKSQLGSAADVTNSADIATATTAPLESVASIALFSLIGAVIAGAVIILLTMIMVVRERRREIGVMKAIGASNIVIMWQFIVEAITLTVLALIVGTGIGVVAATPLTNVLISNDSTSSTNSDPSITQVGGGRRMMRFAGPGQFGQASRKTIENIQASVGGATLTEGAALALVIAILGSAAPSLMISKIKPADAMRNE